MIIHRIPSRARSKRVTPLFWAITLVLWLASPSACAPAPKPPTLPTATAMPRESPTATMTATATSRATATPFPTFVNAAVPTWPPAVHPEVRLEVSSYTPYRFGTGWVYVAGAAVNRGTVAAGEVRIALSLLDAQGKVAATSSTNEAHNWYVPVGGRYPFLVVVATAPKEWKEVKIQFETQPYRPDQLHKPYWSLKVDKVVGQPPKGAYPSYGYTGAVTNTGDRRARMVQITAIAYDPRDQVLDVGSSYIAFEYLNPGQDAPFRVSFKNLKTAPARYEMLAEGHLTE